MEALWTNDVFFVIETEVGRLIFFEGEQIKASVVEVIDVHFNLSVEIIFNVCLGENIQLSSILRRCLLIENLLNGEVG